MTMCANYYNKESYRLQELCINWIYVLMFHCEAHNRTVMHMIIAIGIPIIIVINNTCIPCKHLTLCDLVADSQDNCIRWYNYFDSSISKLIIIMCVIYVSKIYNSS